MTNIFLVSFAIYLQYLRWRNTDLIWNWYFRCKYCFKKSLSIFSQGWKSTCKNVNLYILQTFCSSNTIKMNPRCLFVFSLIFWPFLITHLESIKLVIIGKVCCCCSVLEKKVLLCIEDAYHRLCKRMCAGIIAPFSVIRNFHSSLLLTTHQEKWWKIHFQHLSISEQ